MCFLDEKKQKSVENCPNCGSIFVINEGTKCLTTCPAKKLEKEHEKIARKIIAYCLPRNKKIRIEFPFQTYLFEKGEKEKRIVRWGWSDDLSQTIFIPWYTLRSKKEFFDTIVHEIAHITAYKKIKLFTHQERKILLGLSILEDKWINPLTNFINQKFKKELDKYYNEYYKVIEKYLAWEGHDPNPWHKEYLKFHKKLINSPFVKYAYGNTKPHSYGFDKYGKGQYKPKTIN